MSKRRFFSSLSIALATTAFLGLSATGTEAHAANAACTVKKVEYYPGVMLIQCTTTGNFWAYTTPPAGCSSYAQNLETQKIWLNMGQAALLSGKPMFFYYTSCGGSNILNVVDFGINTF